MIMFSREIKVTADITTLRMCNFNSMFPFTRYTTWRNINNSLKQFTVLYMNNKHKIHINYAKCFT